MKVSLSRQGNQWSKYRCRCAAQAPYLCVCTNLGTNKQKRVTFASLEKRNLNSLFTAFHSERITPPLFGTLNRINF